MGIECDPAPLSSGKKANTFDYYALIAPTQCHLNVFDPQIVNIGPLFTIKKVIKRHDLCINRGSNCFGESGLPYPIHAVDADNKSFVSLSFYQGNKRRNVSDRLHCIPDLSIWCTLTPLGRSGD